jgi:hypothetical protein
MNEDNMSGVCSTHGDMKSAYKILVGKTDWKRPLRKHKHRRRCEGDNMKNLAMKMWTGFNWLRIG